MIILRAQEESQEVFFISRGNLFDKIVIKGESTESEQEFIVEPLFVDYYGKASISPILKEGSTYTLKIYSDESLVYYDMIYCTNQSIVNYDINENQYINQSNPENNGFIVID